MIKLFAFEHTDEEIKQKKEIKMNNVMTPKNEKTKRIHNLHNNISNLSDFYFLLLMVVLGNIVIVIFSPIFNYFVDFESVGDTFYGVDPRNIMLNIIIVAPIFETLLQFLPIELLSFYYKRKLMIKPNYILIGLVSAALFGIIHYPSYEALGGPILGAIKVSCTFVLGLVLSYTYLVYKIKGGRPYLATALLHLLLNLSFYMLPKLYDLIGFN